MRDYRGHTRRLLATFTGTQATTARVPHTNSDNGFPITVAHIKQLSPRATTPHVWYATTINKDGTWRHRHRNEAVKVLEMYLDYRAKYTEGTPKSLKEWRRQVHKAMPYFTPHLLAQVQAILDTARKV